MLCMQYYPQRRKNKYQQYIKNVSIKQMIQGTI